MKKFLIYVSALSLLGSLPVSANDETEETWAVYWYLCGSDLESQCGCATEDLSEMVEVSLPENVTVVVETGGATEWQNETVDPSCLERYVYQDEELSFVDSVPSASMGEASTLADFLDFCSTNYPADHTAVIFWDHGSGSASGVSFDEIYDIYAVRVILDTLAECYSTLGLIHDMYHPLPNRFKDYISTPKPNGYQSLHTTVIGHEGIPFEVQIRTRTMDEQAEYGVAAHWKYKEGLEGHDKLDERLAWVSQLLENQRVSEDSGNLLHDLKSDLLPEEVFAFTPKGDVINLPAGANCIDFAYAIHSAVGNRMVGCKVNNRIVPIDHVVATGEIIEVILGPADKGPSRDWLKIVRTSEAKSKIRNWFKKMRREENIQQGRDALAKELRREMIFIPDDQLDEFVGSCSRRLRQNNAEEIYAAIGYGGMTIANCLPKLKEEWQKLKAAEAAENKSVEDLPKVDLSRVHATDGVVVEGFDNTPIKFAKCCSPLPGDPIVGFITRGFGVSIHKQSCANAVSSMKDPSNAPRWVKAYWADSVKDSYKAGLEIIALNRNELLSDVLAALADIRVPIYAMNARQVENNCAVISLTIGINNTEHLNRVVARLSKVKDVLKVTRS